MKTLNANSIKLIELLNDLNYHSGSKLGKILGVSRTAVWKSINQLQELGITISSDKKKGYCLKEPLILINEDKIRSYLNDVVPPNSNNLLPKLNFHLYASLDSTNQYLKKLATHFPQQQTIELCLSEYQSKGRGRFARVWHSPFGKNIYFSSRWQFDGGLSQLSHLSLITSLAIVKALEQYGVPKLKIKWPNDIYYQGEKLSGCLIEISGEAHGVANVIVGIGLNVNMKKDDKLIDTPWCSLATILPNNHDRNQIIAKLLSQLHKHYNDNDKQSLLTQWQEYDFLYNKQITVKRHKETLHGKSQGIDEQGMLLLLDNNNHLHHLSSGDTSLSTKK